MPKTSLAAARYAEDSIKVLKGLEPVRQRPGMYTSTDTPLHIIQEVIDNAADEALAGHCTHIEVVLHADGSVSVADDGRGIPHGLHPEEGVPVMELVYARLHAGGKFERGGAAAYAFAGGLHGVGVSVTNALSTRLEVTSRREGQAAHMAFAGGDVAEKLTVRALERGEPRHGTTVRAWPDAAFFESAALPLPRLQQLLRSKALLMPGLLVSLLIEATGERQEWRYEGGLRAYLEQELAGAPLIPIFEG
ncbi:MAG: DNA topoisomerase IV subunit B, partial [Ottowia sp.]|nr:DNA topoisomerase IV subunit B [Ottowia sp.]